MRRAILSLAGLLMGCGFGQAADLSVKARQLPPAAVPFSWTGLYIGGHAGGAWGTTESTLRNIDIQRCFTGSEPALLAQVGCESDNIALLIPVSQTQTNGFLGGVQAGYNWQFSPWTVLGVEAQFSWTDLKGTSPCVVVLACSTSHDWLTTVAGRLGVTAERLMIYVKGGIAWAQTNYGATLTLPNFSLATDVSDTRTGWLFGAGVEYAFLGNLSAKIEYNYIDFGDKDYDFVASFANGPVTTNLNFATTIHERIHLVKAGLNYRFDLGKAPAAPFQR